MVNIKQDIIIYFQKLYIPPYFRKILELKRGYLGDEFIGLGHEVPNLIHYTIGPWGFWNKISMTSYTALDQQK